jgi:hypothetical protein
VAEANHALPHFGALGIRHLFCVFFLFFCVLLLLFFVFCGLPPRVGIGKIHHLCFVLWFVISRVGWSVQGCDDPSQFFLKRSVGAFAYCVYGNTHSSSDNKGGA